MKKNKCLATTHRDLIEQVIIPSLGENADDHDTDYIADRAFRFSGKHGGFVSKRNVDYDEVIVKSQYL